MAVMTRVWHWGETMRCIIMKTLLEIVSALRLPFSSRVLHLWLRASLRQFWPAECGLSLRILDITQMLKSAGRTERTQVRIERKDPGCSFAVKAEASHQAGQDGQSHAFH